jgi:uncharacterized protein (TIGR02246 family)
MNMESERIVSEIVADLERAWNTADGAAFARSFAEDADFVNIRGDHLRGRDVIGKGHQGSSIRSIKAASCAIGLPTYG